VTGPLSIGLLPPPRRAAYRLGSNSWIRFTSSPARKPASLFFQFQTTTNTFPGSRQRVCARASSPKKVIWYDALHDLNIEAARRDRREWLCGSLFGEALRARPLLVSSVLCVSAVKTLMSNPHCTDAEARRQSRKAWIGIGTRWSCWRRADFDLVRAPMRFGFCAVVESFDDETDRPGCNLILSVREDDRITST